MVTITHTLMPLPLPLQVTTAMVALVSLAMRAHLRAQACGLCNHVRVSGAHRARRSGSSEWR